MGYLSFLDSSIGIKFNKKNMITVVVIIENRLSVVIKQNL